MKWDGRGLPPALKAHGLLLALQFLPLVVYIPYSFNIILNAALTVYVGSWRSVKKAAPAESMTNHDAMRFPLVGSAVLFGLFLLFKVLPKHLVNMLLATYITAIGALVIVQTATPFAELLFPLRLRERTVRLPTIPKIPYLLPEPLELNPTIPEAVLVVPALALGIWYFFTKKFIANNLLVRRVSHAWAACCCECCRMQHHGRCTGSAGASSEQTLALHGMAAGAVKRVQCSRAS